MPYIWLDFPGDWVVKNIPANAGDTGDAGSIPGWGRSPGEGNGNPLQYSCLVNPMDRGAWRATIHGIAKSCTWLSMHAGTCTYVTGGRTKNDPILWQRRDQPGCSGGWTLLNKGRLKPPMRGFIWSQSNFRLLGLVGNSQDFYLARLNMKSFCLVNLFIGPDFSFFFLRSLLSMQKH